METRNKERHLARMIADVDKELPAVRTVLQKIKVEQQRLDNIRAVGKGKVKEMKETLAYLFNTNPEENSDFKEELDSYVARGLAEKIVKRVENLLPEWCLTCKKEYVGHQEDGAAELTCTRCNRNACPTCIADLKPIRSEIKMMNQGLYHLCSPCVNSVKKQEAFSPEGKKAERKKKKEAVVEKEVESEESSDDDSEEENTAAKDDEVISEEEEEEEGDDDDFETVKTKEEKAAEKKKKQAAKKKEKEQKAKEEEKKKKGVCKHFIRNRCREGVKGEKCSFLHPKKCNKNVKEGPAGCKDKRCNFYHAKVCYGSLAKPRQCLKLHCTFVHLPNTKRDKEEEEDKGNKEKKDGKEKVFPAPPVRPIPEKTANQWPELSLKPPGPEPAALQMTEMLTNVNQMMTTMMSMMTAMKPFMEQTQTHQQQQAWQPQPQLWGRRPAGL